MDHSVKVLLANRPEALPISLATLLQQQSDIEVVDTVLDPVELLVAVEDTQADVVVVTLPDSGKYLVFAAICYMNTHSF